MRACAEPQNGLLTAWKNRHRLWITLRIPIYSDDSLEPVGYQIREDGSVRFSPRGLQILQCLPFIGRILPEGPILACEGPTDAIAAMEVSALDSYSIIGCWSATSTPGRAFWASRFPGRVRPVVACGDNDPSGQTFNQRIANEYGTAYPIVWPGNFWVKGDVKDLIGWLGADVLDSLIGIALLRNPLVGEKPVQRKKKTYTSSPVLISTLVEAAGGKLAYEMPSGSKYYCPLHEDREDASLTVNDETGSFHCWAGCGQGGPAQWLMAWKGLSYEDAMELMKVYL